MKVYLFSTPRYALVVLIAALFGFQSLRTSGQEAGLSTLSAAPKDEAASLLNRQVEDVTFEQLPLAEVVQFLREQFLGLNFVLADELADMAPTLTLRRVTIIDILEGISLATNRLVQYEQVSDRLFHLFPNPVAQQKNQLRAFNLRPYFQSYEGEKGEALKELYQVLDEGWSMVRKGRGGGLHTRRPELSIHQKTNLLIAVGYPSELAVVESIVEALQGARVQVGRYGNTGSYGGGGGGGMGGLFGGGAYSSGNGGADAGYGAGGGYGSTGGGRGLGADPGRGYGFGGTGSSTERSGGGERKERR